LTPITHISRSLLEDRVRPPQLAVLPFQLCDPLGIVGRGTRTYAAIDLGAFDPGPERFGVHTELIGDPLERTRPRRRILAGFDRHPRCSCPQLNAVLPWCCDALGSVQKTV